MSLSLAQSPLLLVLALAVAAAFSYWSYHRTVPQLPALRRGLLAVMRFGALALVVLLLFEPVLRNLEREAQPAALAVLLDNSQSLIVSGSTEADVASDTSADMVRRTLRDALGQELPGDVRYYRFSSGVERLDAPSPFDSLDLQGVRTDIARALEQARDDLQDGNLGGVVLVSDGQYNTGSNPLYVADRYPVPVYTVVVGDTTRQRDIVLRRVNTNEIAYVDTETPVRATIRAEDYAGERVRVSLHENSRTLDARTLDLPDEHAAEATVDLTFTPQEEGMRRLEVRATELPGEATYRNNVSSVSVRVLESRRQILLLGAAPGPDVSATRQVLEQSSNVEVTSRIQRGAGAFYEGELPANLNTYDALVLAGYPGASASASTVQALADAVEGGLPVIFLLTRHTDLPALRRHFGASLPATPETVRETFAEAAPVPTPRGLQHPILEVGGLTAERLTQLPPLHVSTSRWETSPDARVLMTTRVRGVDLDDPLLTVRDRAGSRSAAVLGAGTWRWRNLPDDLQQNASLWPSLLDNTVQWLTTPENDRRVRVEPVRDVFEGGERVEFTGQVYDESLNPVTNASVAVTVTAPDGTQSPYTMEAVGEGRYTLDAGRLPEGTYGYTARATRDGAALGDDRGRFAVGGLNVEFRNTRADVDLMRQIAARSGGDVWFAPATSGLSDRIRSASSFATDYLEQVNETRLWHLYGLLAVIIGLLATEWFVRKRSGMV